MSKPLDPGPRRILMTPGPVDIHPSRWQGLEILHHRSARFREIVTETCGLLSKLAGTEGPAWLITSSGTGAMESAIANMGGAGTGMLVVSGGKFGDRWKEIADARGFETDLLYFGGGKRVDPEQVISTVRKRRPELLALTHVESSTGLLLELKELLAALPEPGPLVILDAVASLGSERLMMDKWGIDLLVGAGQKALAAPAGISFVIAGERARRRMKEFGRGEYYFSYGLIDEALSRGDTPFTPAVQSVQLLHQSLTIIEREGFDGVIERHRDSADAVTRGAGHLSLVPFPENPSSSVLAFTLPDRAASKGILSGLAEISGIIITGGQEGFEGRIIRTGFTGLYSAEELGRLLDGLAAVLGGYGCDIDRNAAIEALETLRGRNNLFSLT